jgi:hypothetical protein
LTGALAASVYTDTVSKAIIAHKARFVAVVYDAATSISSVSAADEHGN